MEQPNTLLEWARYYASLGLKRSEEYTVDQDGICTCKKKDECRNAGKHPALNWQRYTKRRVDDDQIIAWFDGMEHSYNIGVVTGSISGNVFVVDVDTGQGKVGLETLDQVQMAHEDLPITATAKTGSGGKHIFLRAPEGFHVKTDTNLIGKGIDVRGEGGFVVVAPSRHASGNRYTYDMDDIADAPNWILAMVEGHAVNGTENYADRVDQSTNQWGQYDDGREAVMMKTILATIMSYYESTASMPTLDDIIEHGWKLYEMRVATRGGRTLEEDGRGITAFTEKAAYQLARAKRGELHTLNAIRSKMEAMGIRENTSGGHSDDTDNNSAQQSEVALSVQAFLREAVSMAAQEEEKRQTRLHLEDWHVSRFKGEPPEMEYLVEGIFPQGVPALLAASGGIGKSFALLDLALKVALFRGDDPFEVTPFAFGGRVTKGGKVVFLTAEDSADSVHRRLAQISTSDEIGKASPNLIVVPLPDATGAIALVNEGMGVVSMTEHYHDLMDQLLHMEDVALVIIDPLQAFCWADVNADPKAAQVWWTAMSSICAKTGATLIVAHHMRKDGLRGITVAEEAREAIRGSTALVDGARLVYAMWAISGDAEIGPCKALSLPLNKQSIVCGCVVKANDLIDRDVRYYGRGKTGLLEDRTAEVESARRLEDEVSQDQIDKTFSEIELRWNRENPFSNASQTGDRYLVRWMTENIGMTKRAANKAMCDWIDQGYITIEMLSGNTKKKGLCVMHKPESTIKEERGFVND
jgi:RecA-family ATPase